MSLSEEQKYRDNTWSGIKRDLNEKLINIFSYGSKNKEGGPFTAAIVSYNKDQDKYELVEWGYNTVLGHKDPTCHAEINVIRKLCKELNTIDLSDYILIASNQPCPMCYSAARWAKIEPKNIFYIVPDKIANDIGFQDNTLLRELAYLYNENFNNTNRTGLVLGEDEYTSIVQAGFDNYKGDLY